MYMILGSFVRTQIQSFLAMKSFREPPMNFYLIAIVYLQPQKRDENNMRVLAQPSQSSWSIMNRMKRYALLIFYIRIERDALVLGQNVMPQFDEYNIRIQNET